ncbi:hypothetical protein [Microcoleus sp. S13_C3]|uniref:hypothetical protein n=2 Tax=Microcoleus TaxID=44471 RepID=UPI002FCE7290
MVTGNWELGICNRELVMGIGFRGKLRYDRAIGLAASGRSQQPGLPTKTPPSSLTENCPSEATDIKKILK